MRRLVVAVVAVIVVAVGCGGGAGPSAHGVASASAPASSTSPMVSAAPSRRIDVAAPIPAELAYVWLGPARDIAALGGPQALSIIRIRGSNFDYIFGGQGEEALNSTVAVSATGQVTFTSSNTTGGCDVGDEGTYGWTTTADGSGLTMTKLDEACAPRAEAVVGDWVRAACKEFGCLGALEAGAHRTAFFEPLGDPTAFTGSWRMQYGSISYTVPSGWANAVDDPNFYDIVPTDEYAKTVPDMTRYAGIDLIPDVTVSGQDDACSASVEPGYRRSLADMTARIAEIPSLDVGAASPVSIAGRSGTMFDVALKPGWTSRCSSGDGLPILSGDWRIAAGERWRLILLDVAEDRTMAIIINDAAGPSRFDDLVAAAMPIVTSFELHLPS